MSYEALIFIHILSVILLLGIGGGSALYKFIADQSKNLEIIVHTNRVVVIVDWFITTPAVILQPLTGILLMDLMGLSFADNWILISIILYIISIILWIVAVYLQIKMKKISLEVQKKNEKLDENYFRLVKYWTVLGILSAICMGIIFYLMIFK